MRCDGSKLNAQALFKMINEFLSECENASETWEFTSKKLNIAGHLAGKLNSLNVFDEYEKKYVVFSQIGYMPMEQVSKPLTIQKAKAFHSELDSFGKINPNKKFFIFREIEA